MLDDAAAAQFFAGCLRELKEAGAAMVLGAKVRPDDHLGFMALTFHGKQLGHAEAVLVLEDHADAALIARSMLEGLCLLKWAAQDGARSERWRRYSAILDARLLADIDHEGRRTVAPEERQLVQRMLDTLDDSYLSPKALKARRDGGVLPPDPWVSRWYQPQLREIFDAVGASELYGGPYFAMCEWHHWSPGGLARGMWSEGDSIGFSARLPGFQAGWLASAFQALAESSVFTGQHLQLPIENTRRVMERYLVYGADSAAEARGAP